MDKTSTFVNLNPIVNLSEKKNPLSSVCETGEQISRQQQRFILFILFSLVIMETLRILGDSGKVSIFGNTYIFALLEYLSLFIFLKYVIESKIGNDVPFGIKFFYVFWIVINFVNFIRGCFLASNYWDAKTLFLSSFSFSVISLAFYVGIKKNHFLYVYDKFISLAIPLAFVISPFIYVYNNQIFSRIVIPISFILCIIPYLDVNVRKKIILVSILATVLALDFRTNLIKMFFSVGIIFLYGIKNIIPFNATWLVHKILFFVPVIFLILGLSGRLNLFEFMSSQSIATVTNLNGQQISLTGDTRTFLYREVITSVSYSGNLLLGESSSGSYRSIFFTDSGGAMNGRRYGTEVGILNIFLYHGLVGFISYFLLLYAVSSIAINNSNNYLSKMFGLLIASRWALSFIEEYTRFDMNFFFFWLIVGLVSTESFRSLSDEEVSHFFEVKKNKSMFHKKIISGRVG